MEIITVNRENLEKEHICCAISNNKDCQVVSKKNWLGRQFDEGLIFKKGNVRGKCFIEYIQAENAWAPVEADGYMYIDCLWVSGKFKGQGFSNSLLQECIKDSKEKGKKGLVILSSAKKRPYLADPAYLKHKGFQIADKAEPYYELMYLPFKEGEDKPVFMQQVKHPHIEEKGFVLYYSDQCPFTAKYVPLIEEIAKSRNVPFKTVHFQSATEVKKGPAVFSAYSLFYDGEFVTHEILSEKKFEKILDENR